MAVATAAEIREAQAKLTEQAEQMERERRASDRVVNGWLGVGQIWVVTDLGRIFSRVVDPRVANDGRGGERFIWKEVESPLA